MQIFTRLGSEEDVESLITLEIEARKGLDQFRGGSRLASEIDSVGNSWAKMLQDESVVVFVAGVDNVVMGYLVARKGQTKTGRIALIEQVFVTTDARNFGIGDSLVSETLKWAKSLKLVALDALALPGDRETKNLFERSGLVARLITVTTDLTN